MDNTTEAINYSLDHVRKHGGISDFQYSYLIHQSSPEYAALFRAIKQLGLQEARDVALRELAGFWNDSNCNDRKVLQKISDFMRHVHGEENTQYTERHGVIRV